MPRRTVTTLFVLVVLMLVIGCGPAKLNRELPFSVGDVPAQAWVLDPQSVDQMLKVEVTSDGPVDVFVLLGVDEGTAFAMTNDELKQKAVASKTDATKDTITAKIPAKQSPVIVVRFNSKHEKASGKIRLSN